MRFPIPVLIAASVALAPGTLDAAAASLNLQALDEVTVSAKHLAPEVSKFVYRIAATENEGDGLPRWQAAVCPVVLGLSDEVGAAIRERVSVIARAARVRVAAAPCRPNLFAVVTADPKKLLGGLSISARILTFGDVSTPCSLASTFEIDEFIATPRPIRVWYNSMLTDVWGKPATGCTVTAQAGGSHIALGALYDFSSVWVITDYTRVNGVSVQQFADYIAMVGLAQIRQDVQLGDVRSILKLFEGAPAAAPSGLTVWDLSFLKAVYASDRTSKLQRSQIAREMVHEISSR